MGKQTSVEERKTYIFPNGTDPVDPGVATEITLDVEYAHAVAPLATQESYAIFAKAAAENITAIGSAGDSGATSANCTFTDYSARRSIKHRYYKGCV